MSKLAQLRAKLLEKENKQRSAVSDNAIFPFWNINENEMAVIRFLPDGVDNDFFWVDREMIRLTFPGIVGQNNTSGKDVLVQVPCNEMFEGIGSCPILAEVRPWFKEKDMDTIARQYWKKRSYIFQGFIRENPLREDDAPENPIRRLVINPSIFDIIKNALMDNEMEEMPTDYLAGTDFRLTKTKQGEYANYKTSNYSRRSTALNDDELAAIEQYGLKNLSDYLPKQPGAKELEIIKEMFEASVDGQQYDPEKWASYYKPSGFDWNNGNSTESDNKAVTSQVSTATESTSTPQVEETVVVSAQTEAASTEIGVSTVEETSSEGRKDPKDILASIKARAANKG